MTCGWKLEHEPWRTPWKVARRRVCSTDEARYPSVARPPHGHNRASSGDGCAFLCFAGTSSIQLHGADRDLAKA